MDSTSEQGARRRGTGKSAAAFRTISEVATDLDVPPHVLRFWETKFTQIKPMKRGGGRRYYRPEDVDLLRRIRELLYKDGYTIKGVQRLLRDGIAKGEHDEDDDFLDDDDDEMDVPGEDDKPDLFSEAEPADELPRNLRGTIESTIRELLELREILRKAATRN
ncbi:MerR family transcriptional regulator [Oceanibaculum pacificum]|uniref:Transcriptional regulator n=1 Tax=Oceanibaculum pacificum TaxID=580166 RepID=A0A154W8I0_9PROT|nr:MerR family transcriptional regulator [Oceanibaculum pacificum]KZD09827.1 transcriptional regulator [Oceanibaculum pacificum]